MLSFNKTKFDIMPFLCFVLTFILKKTRFFFNQSISQNSKLTSNFSSVCLRLLSGAVFDEESSLAGLFAPLCHPGSGGPGTSFQESRRLE